MEESKGTFPEVPAPGVSATLNPTTHHCGASHSTFHGALLPAVHLQGLRSMSQPHTALDPSPDGLGWTVPKGLLLMVEAHGISAAGPCEY